MNSFRIGGIANYKKLSILLVLALLLVLFSCSAGTNRETVHGDLQKIDSSNTSNLDLIDSRHEYIADGVSIYYPQFRLSNSSLSDCINETIRSEALGILDSFWADIATRTIEIDYSFSCVNDGIISIRFEGLAHSEEVAYPRNLFYVANVCIASGKPLKPEDIFEINVEFAETLMRNALPVVSTQDTSDILSHDEMELECYSALDLLEGIREGKGVDDRIYLYLTEGTIGFNVPTLHVRGDNEFYEVGNDCIRRFIKFNT